MTELERVAEQYANENYLVDEVPIPQVYAEAFIAGANWQYEQFEKNRLAACDNMTKAEQYIKDFTRGYSNELENDEYEYWLTPWHAEAACNLKKEETIEKACEWLKMNYDWIYLRYIRGSEIEDIINEFRKAME